MHALAPTPYPDVNAAVAELRAGIAAILGERLVGLYLFGSLALGDFNSSRSDLDILVVPEQALTEEEFAALAELHARFAASDSPWAIEIEVSYIPRAALRRFDPEHKRYPRIDRGSGALDYRGHDVDWVIQRHVLREYGIVLLGPALTDLIEPVSPDDLRRAEIELMRIWWGPMDADPAKLEQRGYQAYCVLTMCRVLYMLQHGAVVSKPAAAEWARKALEGMGARFGGLLDRALAWRKDGPDAQVVLGDDVRETRALIRYTLARCGLAAPTKGPDSP